MGPDSCALLVVLDGAGDLPNPDLGGKTPLEAASMPNLKAIMSECASGTLYPIGKGIAPESDAAVMSLLGYDVKKEYTGRGPLEAYGAGINVGKDSLALRCNFATVDGNRNIVDRRAGRNVTQEDAKALEGVINRIRVPGARLTFRATVGHRGVLLLEPDGAPLSGNVSNADIGYVRSGSLSVATESASTMLPQVEPLDGSAEAARTAKLLNSLMDSIILALSNAETNRRREAEGKLPANVLLMRDAGVGLPEVDTFEERFGVRSAFIADMPVERGIAKLAGMCELSIEPGLPNGVKYTKMADMVNKNYRDFGFMYVHIKGPDEPGHDGDARRKTQILEEIDRVFFKDIERLAGKITICVTADHSTPCIMKGHSADPVPVAIRSTDHAKNKDHTRFSERGVRAGSLGTIIGGSSGLIKLLLAYR